MDDAARWEYFKRYCSWRRVPLNGNIHTYVQIEILTDPSSELAPNIDGAMDELIKLGDKHNLHHTR